MKTETLKTIGLLLLAAILGAVFAWLDYDATPDVAQKKTEAAYSAVTATIDERLPAVVPQRYKETQERTVKVHSETHKEAQTLSGDGLSTALNRELRIFDGERR